MSAPALLSPLDRLVEVDENTTDLPDRAIWAPSLEPLPAAPLLAADARNVRPLNAASRPLPPSTCTYAWCVPGRTEVVFAFDHAALVAFVSARLVASEENATRSQSPVIEMS